MKKIPIVFACLIIVQFTKAQLFVGGAYGTFHVLATSKSLKGMAPTLRIEYTPEYKKGSQFFLDASVYNKTLTGYYPGGLDAEGNPLPSGSTSTAYSIKHVQLGFKNALAGDFSESRMNFFLGGGGVLSFIKYDKSYKVPNLAIPNEKLNETNYGFHFNAGGQLRLKMVVIELRGNFDFLMGQIPVEGSENTHFISSTRLGITVPLTKWKE